MYDRNVQLGSQLYINKTDTPAQVKQWVKQMRAAKLRLIRLFMVWDQLEPADGVWNFEAYDACFQEAERQRMQIIPTLMSVSPPSWMRMSSGTQDVADLDDPAYWARSMQYVEKVVERYAGAQALHSWILWNEPSRVIQPDKADRADFAAFLRHKYRNDIRSLNRSYYCQYQTFEELSAGQQQAAEALVFSGYAERVDWQQYCVHNLNQKLCMLAEKVRSLDGLHPVHVNPHNIGAPNYFQGQAIFQEAETVDFLGCSAHPSWHSTRFPTDRIHQSVAYFADLMKSASKSERFWVSELQGGTNIFSGVRYMCPRAADIRHWLWEGIGAGSEAVLFWCFNTRNSGFEGGEWGLLNQLQKPSERLQAATEVAGIIEEHQALFNRAQAEAPDVWILYSDNSILLGTVEGEAGSNPTCPRNQFWAADAVAGAYLACSDLGYTVQMIDEAGVQAGKLPPNAVLLVPGAYALEAQTCLALQSFVKHGGHLVADGLCGMKDPHGFLSAENRTVLAEVFGAEVEDIQACTSEFYYSLGDKMIPGWFIQCELLPLGGRARGYFPNGKPAVTEQTYGKGRAVRIGSIYFQQYFAKPAVEIRDSLKALLGIEKAYVLENGTHHLRMKTLCSGEDRILILCNREQAQTARLRLPNGITLTALDDSSFRQHGTTAEIELEEGGAAVFCTKRIIR